MLVNRHVFESISKYVYDCTHIAYEYLQII
jgi:hypothetical protein